MVNKKNNFLIQILIILLMFNFGNAKLLNTSSKDALTNLKESVTENSPELFDLLFAESKSYYVEAMIAEHFKDSSEVKYCLDRSVEIIAEIRDLDSLTLLQRDDYRRFCEKLNTDFKTIFAYVNGDIGTRHVSDMRDEINNSMQDTVNIGSDKLIILDDRTGHLPIVTSKKIERIITYFQTKQRTNFQQWLNNAGKYKELMVPILKKEGLPEEIFYLALIESGFKTSAYSYAHAAGCWQFIASTGAYYGLKRNWWIDERRDPIKATIAAAQFLSDLHDYFNDWYLAIAAYNCGKLNVIRAIRREGTRDYWKMKTLPRQTRNYIPTFMAGMIIAKNPEKYGFEDTPDPTWEWDEVVIKDSYELEAISKACGVTAKVLKEYNPELRRWMTPPDKKSYTLKLPRKKGKDLITKLKHIPKSVDGGPQFVTHRVRRGQTLGYIARKYRTSVSSIVSANNIRNRNALRIGQSLRIPSNNYYSKRYINTSQSASTHLVKKGESLYEIAQHYKVTLSALRAQNNLYGKRFIYPGQKLSIPGKGKMTINTKTATKTKIEKKTTQNKVVHVVKKGETLSGIAEKYRVGLSKVRYWNNIYGRKVIYPGQKLSIYQ